MVEFQGVYSKYSPKLISEQFFGSMENPK